MRILNYAASRLGFVRKADVDAKLQFARSVGKRLDEHREVVESMVQTGFFVGRQWHVGHMAVQDDYFMRLYHMVHGVWPDDRQENGRQANGEYVRHRPNILGRCGLAEFSAQPQ